MSSTSALEAQLRRESAAKVSGMGCWLTKPASEKAPKEKGDAQAAGKAPRKPFALWGSKREVTPPGAPAPDAPASESDDLEGLSSKLFDVDLGALDHPNTPPAKGAKPVPASPVHRRVWSFGRKVAPAVEPEPAPSAEALLDTAQSDDLPRISATSTDSSESSSTATAASAAAGADGIATLAPEQPAARPQGYRRLWQSIVRKGDSVPAHMASQLPDVTVEGIVHRVQRLKMGRPVMEAVQDGLPFLDSRAVAALLKELSKGGLPHRAAELFDWLRSLPADDPLAKLADLYTYTTIISQCGTHQQLRRALELVGEMRARGIEANIHTYSALMSVCVKCNECDLALDVYQQLLAEGCTPNLVTSNILIDIYGKTGQWARAVEVLDNLQAQGTTAEPRTYNTVISACAKSGQPAAAFRTYQRMLVDGVAPTSTTYTTLISAYGKAGQVEEALAVYEDMAARGCERNVITYSSLISACERAGRCDLALRLFLEMQAQGIRPNVVTYNGIIGACGQAGLWHKAAELFDAMFASGCRPDAVTYSVLIGAYERGGQWQRALQTFERMQQQHRPDACVLNSVLEALWASGLMVGQAKALQLAAAAFRQGHLRLSALSAYETSATAHTFSAVFAVLLRWLVDLREQQPAWPASGGARLSLLLARGKHSRMDQGYTHIAACLSTMFGAFSAPLVAEVTPQGLAIHADAGAVLSTWLASSRCAALVSPMAAAAGAPIISAALLHEDATAERRCAPAFAAVAEFEATHVVLTDAFISPAAASLRQELVSALLSLGQGLQLAEEVVLEGVQLCDRLLNRGAAPASLEPTAVPLYASGALLACARQAGDQARMLCGQHALMQLAGLTVPAVLEAEQQLVTALHGDVAAISALRVLHLYFERLGCSLMALQQCELMQVMALAAANITSKAALSPAFVRYPPSLVAAAGLCKARQSLGLHPAWPSCLGGMTGYSLSQPLLLECCDVIALLGLSA